jgi:hypothetical protein
MPFIWDLTGRGVDSGYFRNAHLSDAVKQAMVEAHDAAPGRATVQALAERYKVRKQRVLGIIMLKKVRPSAHVRLSQDSPCPNPVLGGLIPAAALGAGTLTPWGLA